MTRPDPAFDMIQDNAPSETTTEDGPPAGVECVSQAVERDIPDQVPDRASKPFSGDNARLAGLTAWRSGKKVVPPHVLADDIWISFVADVGADIAVYPSTDLEGAVIDVKDIGASPWMSLSWRIDPDTVRSGRYLCFVMKMRSPGFLSYRPCLRYVSPSGTFKDVFSVDYIVSSGGESEQLSWVQIDVTQAASAKLIEAHVFFQGPCFTAEIRSIRLALVD